MTILTILKNLLARFIQLYQSLSSLDQKLNGVAILSSNLMISPVTFSDLRLRLPMAYFLVTPVEERASSKLQGCFTVHTAKMSLLAQGKGVPAGSMRPLRCVLCCVPENALIFPSASSQYSLYS